MTNIITAITFTLLVTNWHGVENTQNEVEIVTRQTHLQFGTNTFLLSSEDTIGAGGLRKRTDTSNFIFVTNWNPGIWRSWTNAAHLSIPDLNCGLMTWNTNQ